MDSNEINTIVRQIGITNFLGVFAVNELISIPPKTEGILIFNTEPAQENGQHWIAICINKTNVFYYDSLNTDFYLSEHVVHLFQQMRKTVFLNNIQIQTNNSDHCGVHCLVFCFVMSKMGNLNSFKSFLKTFDPLNTAQREELSLAYFAVIKQYGWK
jgi:hypothetical protein